MTLTLLDAIERPAILGPDRDDHGCGDDRAPCSAGGAPTLDDLLTGAWDALTAGRTAACPVCSGPLEPRYGAGPTPVGGRCTRCGSELS